MSDANTISDALRRDLSLVLPVVRPAPRDGVRVTARGQPVSMEQGLTIAGRLMRDSGAAAVAGLSMLSIEAARFAIALAEALRGRLLPWPAPPAGLEPLPVTQTATLGHVFASDFILKPGPDRWCADHPIAAAVAERVLHSVFIPSGLDDLLKLRRQVRQRGAAALTDITMQPLRRLAVVLPPGTQAPMVSQWHKLAAELQRQVRVCVFVLPEMKTFGNLRGVIEAATWQTGVSLARQGGIAFLDGAPRACPDLGKLTVAQALDLLIEAGPAPAPLPSAADQLPRIRIGDVMDPAAEVCFLTPGLALGLAARVMRCDGIVLWLSDDPARAPADPAVNILQSLLERANASS